MCLKSDVYIRWLCAQATRALRVVSAFFYADSGALAPGCGVSSPSPCSYFGRRTALSFLRRPGAKIPFSHISSSKAGSSSKGYALALALGRLSAVSSSRLVLRVASHGLLTSGLRPGTLSSSCLRPETTNHARTS